MTKAEQDNLVNSLDQASIAIEKARYIMQEISERYFEAFNPEDSEGSILGYFTDDCITIINGRAIGIYAAAIGSNDLVSVVASRLWPDMVAAGIRCNKSNRRWAGRYYEVRKLYRADIDRLMPGWKLGEES